MQTDGREDVGLAFQHLMDAAPVMIWISGTDKRCTWFNKPWLDFTGRSMDQELGDGWAEGVHPADFQHCLNTYTSHFERRIPFTLEYRLRRADGQYRWILDNGAPRFDTDGTFLGYIGSCTDINAIKSIELGLKETVNSRTLAVAALDRIVATLGHEFKNVLGSVVLYVGVIQRNSDDPAIVRRISKQAEDAIIDGERIVAGLLAAVRHHPALETVHINTLITDTDVLLRGATGGDIALEMDLAAQPDNAIIDPVRFQAVLLNLVTNARQAMPKGGMVRISTRNMTVGREAIDEPDLQSGRYIVVAVSDTGLGMDDEVLQRVFEPFFTTKGDQGTGLGLFSVLSFARNSGGTARIESAIGEGTTVRIYLPEAAISSMRQE